MSGGYWSILAAMTSPRAAVHYGLLSGSQWRRQLCAIRAERAGVALAVTVDPYWVESVDMDPDVMRAVEDDAVRCEVAVGAQSAPLVALDRMVALPGGVSLLDGQAIAWLPPERRDRFDLAWQRLLERVGGPAAVGGLVSPLLDRWAAREAVDALDRVLDCARRQDLDLLLISSAR